MVTAIKRQPLEYYFGLKYPVTIEEAPEGGYFAEIKDLPGCFAQGETVAEAHEMIEIARRMWLEVAYEDGQDIPLPRDLEQYSGKFFIRTSKSLHLRLDQMADREGVSLNLFLVATLSRAVGLEETRRKKSARK